MTRRPSLRCASLFLAFASLPLAACGKSGEKSPDPAQKSTDTAEKPADTAEKPAGATAVTLQLNWTPEPEFGGFYAAVHKGLYAQEGLDVTIQAGGAGIQTWQMVATGKVPFAIAESGEILRGRLKDADLVALYAVYQTSPQALMVHKASGVTSLADIFTSGKIKKVAMESGLPYVKFIEKKWGLGKVEVVQHGGNLSVFLGDPAMAQQCFAFAEPVSAKEKGVEVSAFPTAEAGFNPYVAVLVTSENYLAENRALVEKFQRATRAGWRAYLDDPVPTNQYMKEQGSPMSIEAMKEAAALQEPYVLGDGNTCLGCMSEERWKTLAEQLKELGELDQVPDVSKAFSNLKAN